MVLSCSDRYLPIKWEYLLIQGEEMKIRNLKFWMVALLFVASQSFAANVNVTTKYGKTGGSLVR